MPTPKVIILSYPGALQSAVLDLLGFFNHAGIAAGVVTDPLKDSDLYDAVILPSADQLLTR